MTNETVKYHHDLDWIALGKVAGLNPANARVFFALMYKFKDRGTKRIVMSWDELKALSKWRGPRNIDRFQKALETILDDVVGTYIKQKEGRRVRYLALFNLFEIDGNTQTLTAAVNPDFAYILNNLGGFYSFYQLQDFLVLKTKYGQNLFRLLREYKNKDDKGWRKIPIEWFREYMGVPKSYSTSMIARDVINPAIVDLNQWNLFPGIQWKYKKKPGTRGRGGKVEAVLFWWQASLFDPDEIESAQTSLPFLSDGEPE